MGLRLGENTTPTLWDSVQVGVMDDIVGVATFGFQGMCEQAPLVPPNMLCGVGQGENELTFPKDALISHVTYVALRCACALAEDMFEQTNG